MKYGTLIVFAIFSALNGVSQSTQGTSRATQGIPVQFDQFFRGYSIINPAMNGVNGVDVELELGKHRGWKTNHSTTYASGFFKLKSKTKKGNNFHVPGLSFYGDREGQYLKRSAVYLTYSWHTRLTKKISMAGGSSVGLYTYQVAAADKVDAGGTDNAPDASVGLSVYAPTFFAAASINQIFGFPLYPVDYEIPFERHLNIMGGFTYKASKALTVSPMARIRVAPTIPVTEVDIAAIGTIQKLVVVGVNYRHQRTVMGIFGLENLNIGLGNLKAGLSYAIPIGSIPGNFQTYELTLNYQYTKPKKKLKK